MPKRAVEYVDCRSMEAEMPCHKERMPFPSVTELLTLTLDCLRTVTSCECV